VGLSAALTCAGFDERPRMSAADGVLIGTECPSCAQRTWPGRAICAVCGTAGVTEVPLAKEGTLMSSSTVWVGRPGLEPPYVVAQVLLADGVRLFGHLREMADRPVGAAVRVVIAPAAETVPPFWFEPA
jgi:uncharacterized OB-fold protein